MDNGFVRLSIFEIFLPGYLRFSEVVAVVVFFFVKKRSPEIFGINTKRPLYNLLMKVKLLYVLELSTGPIRVANSFG